MEEIYCDRNFSPILEKKKKDKAQKMLFLIVLLVAKAVSDGHQQSESIFATVLELYIHNS